MAASIGEREAEAKAGAEARAYRLGLAFVLAATVLWSLGGFFTRVVAVDAWTTLYWRGLFGFLALSIWELSSRRRRALDDLERMGTAGWAWALFGVIGMVSYITSVRLTTVAHNSIIWTTIPFVTAAIAFVLFRERVGGRTIAASAVALSGIVIMIGGSPGEGDVLGDILAFTMTLGGAAGIIISRRNPTMPAQATAAVAALLSAVAALPFAAPASVSGHDLAYLFVFGVTQGTLGMSLYAIGSRHLPSSATALVSTLEAPLGPFWVWLLLGETVSWATIGGGEWC
ncbi:MAG: DMT family transporter [Hyphomicrobiaceae bacterium]